MEDINLKNAANDQDTKTNKENTVHKDATAKNSNEKFLNAIKEEIEKLKTENESLKNQALLYRADNENLRKRFEKEKEDLLKFSYSKFAKDMLSVSDSLEMALKNSEDKTNYDSVIEGIKITSKELSAVFQRNGVTKVNANKGDAFDHNYHQIMCELEDDSVEAGKIVTVYQAGYTINGRLLRPALVGVAKKR